MDNKFKEIMRYAIIQEVYDTSEKEFQCEIAKSMLWQRQNNGNIHLDISNRISVSLNNRNERKETE